MDNVQDQISFSCLMDTTLHITEYSIVLSCLFVFLVIFLTAYNVHVNIINETTFKVFCNIFPSTVHKN